MKRYMLLMIAFMGLTALESQAQSKEAPAPKQETTPINPEMQAERQTNRVTKELGLTADQQKQFKAFALERINTVQPLREKIRTTEDTEERKKLHEQTKAAHEKFDASVKGILTAEQLPKWEAHKKQTLENRKGHLKQRRENQDSDH